MSGLDSSPGATGEESLSPLEQEVLDEYVRLAGNLGDVSFEFFPWYQEKYHIIIQGLSCESLYHNYPLTISKTQRRQRPTDRSNSFLFFSMILLPVLAQRFWMRWEDWRGRHPRCLRCSRLVFTLSFCSRRLGMMRLSKKIYLSNPSKSLWAYKEVWESFRVWFGSFCVRAGVLHSRSLGRLGW